MSSKTIDTLHPPVDSSGSSPHLRKKAPQRNHQFDLLRILFSTMVLLAHAPEMTDGNRSREIFTRITHSPLSLGDIAVDGFFLLSGFLILRSWLMAPSPFDYLQKRVLRIYPGFLVASVASIFFVGLLAPGIPHFFRVLNPLSLCGYLLTLRIPFLPPVLPGEAYTHVNISLWTIPYEFRCYLIVLFFGLCGVFRRTGIFFLITILLVACWMIPALSLHLQWTTLRGLTGDPISDFRLTSVFFVGGCFYLLRERIIFRKIFAFLSILVVALALFFRPDIFELTLVIFGGYLLFYSAKIPARALSWMQRFPDISYGVYLYGWPVQALWIWYHHGSPWITFLVSVIACYALGFISWHYLERPALKLKRKSTARLPPP